MEDTSRAKRRRRRVVAMTAVTAIAMGGAVLAGASSSRPMTWSDRATAANSTAAEAPAGALGYQPPPEASGVGALGYEPPAGVAGSTGLVSGLTDPPPAPAVPALRARPRAVRDTKSEPAATTKPRPTPTPQPKKSGSVVIVQHNNSDNGGNSGSDGHNKDDGSSNEGCGCEESSGDPQ